MEFVILVISAIVAALVHYMFQREPRDTPLSVAFGAGLVVFALIPFLAALFSSR